MRKLLALFLTLAMTFAISTSAFAVEITSDSTSNSSEVAAIEPRIGYAGHVSHYHNGSSIHGSFTMNVNTVFLPMNQWTLKTSGFSSGTTIVAGILDPNGRQVNQSSIVITGNNERENQPLVPNAIMNGTYTIRYDVWTSLYDSEPGTLEVWIY